MVNDIRACTGNACVRISTPLQAFIHETDANSELQRYTAELQDRAPLQAQSDIQFWLDGESSYKRLSQLALDLVASPASHARCTVIWQQENRPKRNMSLYRRVFLKLNRHILHWTQCTVNWSVTCFWYCRRTAEDTLQRLRFWFLLTYFFSHTAKTVTKTKNETRTKLKR